MSHSTRQFSSTGAPLFWEATPNARLTVLVVDDYEDARKLTSCILRQFSLGPVIFVIEAENGVEALELLEKEEVNLVLADWIMPEMDGFEMLKAIRQREKTKDIPVIMLTAVSNGDDVVKAMSAGATDYIVKPFTVQSLEQKIKTLLTAPRSEGGSK
jgi:two-component system chemotaxis response regulator CheY